MIGNNGLDTCVNEYGLSKPSQILDALNKYVEETFEKSADTVNDGMDIALCLFDFTKNEVEYAGANIPLYMVQGNELLVTLDFEFLSFWEFECFGIPIQPIGGTHQIFLFRNFY